MSANQLSRRQVWRMTIQNWIIGSLVKPSQPFTVLDCGTEYGHSAKSIRQAFPASKFTGVEVHGPTAVACREQAGYLYDEIWVEDIHDHLVRTSDRYDVILAAEIIEHMEKTEGRLLLNLLPRRCRLAIVTSPIGLMPQGAIDGNPHQVHKTGWFPHDFEVHGYRTFATLPTCSLGVYFKATPPDQVAL